MEGLLLYTCCTPKFWSTAAVLVSCEELACSASVLLKGVQLTGGVLKSDPPAQREPAALKAMSNFRELIALHSVQPIDGSSSALFAALRYSLFVAGA